MLAAGTVRPLEAERSSWSPDRHQPGLVIEEASNVEGESLPAPVLGCDGRAGAISSLVVFRPTPGLVGGVPAANVVAITDLTLKQPSL